MKISKGFKYELRLTEEQKSLCNQTVGCCRYVWNKGLELKKKLWEEKKENLSRFDLDGLLTEWKEKLDWLGIPPSQALQQVNKDLAQAFENFFNGSGYPTFKKKGIYDRFRLPQGIELKQQLSKKVGQVKLPKLGIVQFTKTREIEGEIKHVTISKHCGKWYISFNCEIEKDIKEKKEGKEIGIDRGINIFAKCSDETDISSIFPLKKNLDKLAKLQRKMSKKKKFSSNWKKLKRKLSKVHNHIANVRKDYLHKKTTELSKSHRLIVLEDLKVGNMSKSAKGTKENPGKNVKAKSGLNRSILDQGWYMFQKFLEYKMKWNGGRVLYVDPKYTSQKCSICGHISKENRKSQAEFKCEKCGYEANADLNASRNILAEGQAVIACGVETLVSTVKQELGMRKPILV
jgi:putative transposase